VKATKRKWLGTDDPAPTLEAFFDTSKGA